MHKLCIIISLIPYLYVHVCNRAKCNSNISMSLAELNSTNYGSAQKDPSCSISDGARIGVYSGLVLGVLLLNLARGVLFTYLLVNASRVLHNRMLSSIIRAPVLFFDNNPIGESVRSLHDNEDLQMCVP